jgi:NAD(P)-dependent dehydrogenase (short-subunit alcohol dehydrogenase family)
MQARHVALVTGAGRGIGLAIAERLAREGAAVIAAARDEQACASFAARVKRSGGEAWPLDLDVTDHEALPERVASAARLCASIGPIDWLINNAGIAESAPFLEPLDAAGRDLYQRHMDTNFHGPRRLVEALVPGMIERGHGRVINVASSAGLRGYAYAAAYAASKHALVGYSLSAALELAKTGVTMNLICPHYVDSPMTDASVERVAAQTGRKREDVRRFFAGQNPGGSLVSVEEIADVAWRLSKGDENGVIVELIGGARDLPLESRQLWHKASAASARSK